jgi:CBS domain containing-hemolysin-like protein
MVDAGQQEGVLEEDEREMIYSIFQLGDTLVREIMVPRIDITAIDVQSPIPQAIDNLLASGFSRVPVYEETVDNILGLLYTKDILRFWREGIQAKSLRDLLRPPYFVPEAKKVDELLAEMQSQRIHMAMIVDEYGGIAGLVTLEDIVEEIVGEIQDEFDQAEESPFQQIDQDEYIFQGRITLDDFNEVMGSHLPSEEADTLSGFIYNRIGRVPTVQEMIRVNGLILTVEMVIGRRIRKVRARHSPSASNGVDKPESDHASQEDGDDHP